jgi:hypothetical protein
VAKPLRAPMVTAFDELVEILTCMAAREAPYEKLALTLASESVPVKFTHIANPAYYECALTIEADHGKKQFFPHFEGAIRVTPVAQFGSELVLQGEYELPTAVASGAHDMADLCETADKALAAMVKWLAMEIAHRIEMTPARFAQRRRAEKSLGIT